MYKITITKVEEVTKVEKGAWVVVESRPYTKDELASVYNPKGYDGQTVDVHGYSPNREVTKDVETKVLEQSLEDIDLVEVIKAINGIKEGVYHD